ncbi:MAG: hypothetical protein CSA62_11605 [Planctomycetota bacterium]|nr:MAG: hypothetical protein CSA62_11605 [Planctomycetota bacterium]
MLQFALEVLADPSVDHFTRLHIKRDPAVCPTTLEIRYLRASRLVHPDTNNDTSGQAAIEASALLNEAQRILAKPWERYPYLAELLVPGVMDATKQLDPIFLMEAMELGEEVEAARQQAEARIEKQYEIEGKLVAYAHEIEELLRSENDDKVRKAARLCHEAKYYQRALEILKREKRDGIPD